MATVRWVAPTRWLTRLIPYGLHGLTRSSQHWGAPGFEADIGNIMTWASQMCRRPTSALKVKRGPLNVWNQRSKPASRRSTVHMHLGNLRLLLLRCRWYRRVGLNCRSQCRAKISRLGSGWAMSVREGSSLMSGSHVVAGGLGWDGWDVVRP